MLYGVIPAITAAEEQAHKVGKIKDAIEEDPKSYSRHDLKKEEEKLKELKEAREAAKKEVTKPDNTKKWFEDWDRPNVYGLTIYQEFFCLYIPSFLSFAFVLFLQSAFIFYIRSVVAGKRDENSIEFGEVVCYGSSIKPNWDADAPVILRVICLLTFITEVARVRVESTAPVCFITYCLIFVC
jgi:hypothetical protein